MPKVGPIKRRDLIRNLRTLEFEGPFSGGKHEYMIRNQLKLAIPNPHQRDISEDLLIRILRQAEIDRKLWEELP
jgi:hypothetical protein